MFLFRTNFQSVKMKDIYMILIRIGVELHDERIKKKILENK